MVFILAGRTAPSGYNVETEIIEQRKPEINVEDGAKSIIIAELATRSFKSNELIKI